MITAKKFQHTYNYGFIDETTKKEIRRKLLKAVAIPGYQVPYSSPEMPIARGWGTGGLHASLSLIGPPWQRVHSRRITASSDEALASPAGARRLKSRQSATSAPLV